jgi:uncharacterized protein YndB with AHSA1/START domain
MDQVFRALNDASRRKLLDALYEADGQTLGELCELLPEMTRFGVMNHLGVLEDAGVVVTRKDGRRKLHYLNPVPIRLVADRWISKFAAPTVGAMAAIKHSLEEPVTNAPSHVYETYIAATPERVWQALVDGEQTARYYYGTRVDSSWEVGSSITYYGQDESVVADGEILSFDEGKLLELTFRPRWDPEIEADGPCRMIWKVDQVDGLTHLVAEAWDVKPGSRTDRDFGGGLVYIVSGLKTVVETGAPMMPIDS